MSSASFPLIRPLAVPVEHGAWGFLLEPIVLGLLVAPSAAGVFIGIGTISVFLLRQPAKLALRDWQHNRYPRTAVCEALVCIYGIAAVIAFGAVFSRALLPLLFAIPFAAVQFVYDYRNQNRTLIAELCGAIAPAAVIASIVLAAGKPIVIAAGLAAAVLGRSIPAVLYVRSVLRGESRVLMLAAHMMAIAVAAFVSWTTVIAMALLLARAIPPADGVRAQIIGKREIGWGVCFVVLTAVGAHL
jgi:hypothetical protein